MTDYDDYIGAMHDLEYAISVATNYKQRQALMRIKDIFSKLRPEYTEEEDDERMTGEGDVSSPFYKTIFKE